ncbi:MAG: aspartate carbamoyltransferase [Armatimonadia bacterium]
MSLAGRSLISLKDLTTAEILYVLDVAGKMATAIGFDDPSRRTPVRPLDRILASLFFEPSTRTRLSFDSAMLRLGGQVLGFADPSASSVQKGETLADTIRMAAGYSDIIVIRHPRAGAARVAAESASVPVINAGDGPHEHPTQTLTDLFCIQRNRGTLSGLRVGLCGDLKYGRTVHSLGPIMARFGSDIVCVSPPELRMPAEFMDGIAQIGGKRPTELHSLEEALPNLDILYMTRVQRERFDSPEEYERVRGCFILTPELMALAPEDSLVLHPLPRVDEISTAVDEDPRAKYFEQAAGGVPIRMALIAALLGVNERGHAKGSFRLDAGESGRPQEAEPAEPDRQPVERVVPGVRCSNPKCVVSTESYLEPLVYEHDGGLRCAYCEQIV